MESYPVPVFRITNRSWTYRATIATNFSYLIPIVARQTIGRNAFRPAAWNLGLFSPFLGLLAALYIMFLFSVLLLPQVYPVTAVSFPKILLDFPSIWLFDTTHSILETDS